MQLVPEALIAKVTTTIGACLLQPSSIGFNMADLEIATKLPQEVIKRLFLVQIIKNFSNNNKNSIGK